MNYIYKLLKAIPIVFVLGLGLAPLSVQGQTCEEALQQAKKAYKEEIEKEYINCSDDDKCLDKVTQNAKKHPYLSQYKKCRRTE